jgi:hypothetical protein
MALPSPSSYVVRVTLSRKSTRLSSKLPQSITPGDGGVALIADLAVIGPALAIPPTHETYQVVRYITYQIWRTNREALPAA